MRSQDPGSMLLDLNPLLRIELRSQNECETHQNFDLRTSKRYNRSEAACLDLLLSGPLTFRHRRSPVSSVIFTSAGNALDSTVACMRVTTFPA